MMLFLWLVEPVMMQKKRRQGLGPLPSYIRIIYLSEYST